MDYWVKQKDQGNKNGNKNKNDYVPKLISQKANGMDSSGKEISNRTKRRKVVY